MNQRDPLLLFFLISLLIHLFLALTSADYLEKKKIEESPAVQVTLLNRKYQIADIDKPEKEQRPKEAKFMGLYDSTVEKEQVSTSQPKVASVKQASKEPSKVSEERPNRALPVGADAVNDHASKHQMRGERGTPPTIGGDGPVVGGQRGRGERLSSPVIDGVPGDFFPDYKRGDKTYLNVLRFPQVEYFVRLKKIFRTTFDPVPALRSSVTSMQISRGQVEVKLAVSIDQSGTLDEFFVINSSGLLPYDLEAMRTIKASSPFAKPPAELLDAASKLRMVWTFTVYL